MTLGDIYNILNTLSPFALQESWDNSGLLVGDKHSKIHQIYLSLEATKEIAQKIAESSLLITHHPLIFNPLHNLNFEYYPNNILQILLQKNISLIAMHTNFDSSHLNEYFTKEILGFDKYIKDNCVCFVESNTKFATLLKHIKTRMPHTMLKFVQSNEYIKNIAIICGAGLGALGEFKNIDCIITGDIKYHDAMKCKSLGISLIDIGHYDSECNFPKILHLELQKLNYNAIILDSQNPFSFI